MIYINQKVRVKDIKFGEIYENAIVDIEMAGYVGQESQITDQQDRFFKLEIDDGKFCWAEEMLEVI